MTIMELKKIQEGQNLSLAAWLKDNTLYTSAEKGIKPVLSMELNDKYYFEDATIVDRIVGKAAAMLFARSKASYIHAGVLSSSAKKVLDDNKISYTYDTMVDFIKNRSNTGMCPMEETVLNEKDPEKAYMLLLEKQKALIGR